MVDFRKVFFPTGEEKRQQKELLNRLERERVLHFMNQGFNRQEAEEQIDKEVKEFTERDYYS
ncbi:hypothetical protein BAOM_3008 [Peribacillus asahii]|uniref:Uncharacterized protein n=1 Tax=Peribacillus asahii TaxID=228899 RepID=A0A3Q9RP31_9BACI|nr:hypothetical protein [Peribacillus asahii]AZV43617.1 hypothetical protein BAOM_3008 [Peribacillus asahii]